MKPHRLQLHQLGVPAAVYASRRAWGYFLDHGELPSLTPGGGLVFSVSSLTEHEKTELHRLLLALGPAAWVSSMLAARLGQYTEQSAVAEDDARSEDPKPRRRRGATTR
jgi:hypothetical protein